MNTQEKIKAQGHAFLISSRMYLCSLFHPCTTLRSGSFQYSLYNELDMSLYNVGQGNSPPLSGDRSPLLQSTVQMRRPCLHACIGVAKFQDCCHFGSDVVQFGSRNYCERFVGICNTHLQGLRVGSCKFIKYKLYVRVYCQLVSIVSCIGTVSYCLL